jgi:hypothetical protein
VRVLVLLVLTLARFCVCGTPDSFSVICEMMRTSKKPVGCALPKCKRFYRNARSMRAHYNSEHAAEYGFLTKAQGAWAKAQEEGVIHWSESHPVAGQAEEGGAGGGAKAESDNDLDWDLDVDNDVVVVGALLSRQDANANARFAGARAPLSSPPAEPVLPKLEPVRAPLSPPPAEPVRAPLSPPPAEPVRAPLSPPPAEPVRAPLSSPSAEPVRAPLSPPSSSDIVRDCLAAAESPSDSVSIGSKRQSAAADERERKCPRRSCIQASADLAKALQDKKDAENRALCWHYAWKLSNSIQELSDYNITVLKETNQALEETNQSNEKVIQGKEKMIQGNEIAIQANEIAIQCQEKMIQELEEKNQTLEKQNQALMAFVLPRQ